MWVCVCAVCTGIVSPPRRPSVFTGFDRAAAALVGVRFQRNRFVLLLVAKTRTGPDHGVRGLRDSVPGSGPGSRATIDVCVPIAIMIIIIIITTILLSTYPIAVDHARTYCFRFRIGYPPDGYTAPTDFCFPASYNILSNRNLEHGALYIVYDYGRRDGFIITNTRPNTAGHTRYTLYNRIQ